jgi:hypothetical protein
MVQNEKINSPLAVLGERLRARLPRTRAGADVGRYDEAVNDDFDGVLFLFVEFDGEVITPSMRAGALREWIMDN